MSSNLRFVVFVFVALAVFVVILRFVLRGRVERPTWMRVLIVATVLVAGGMLFTRFGQHGGLPWWIYYTVPMVITVAVPPIVFGMNQRETLMYLALAFLSSPVIHVFFSFFLGWHEYMPFIRIPAMWEL